VDVPGSIRGEVISMVSAANAAQVEIRANAEAVRMLFLLLVLLMCFMDGCSGRECCFQQMHVGCATNVTNGEACAVHDASGYIHDEAAGQSSSDGPTASDDVMINA
jgi:hypothetical protein